jgi:hypothetical protein
MHTNMIDMIFSADHADRVRAAERSRERTAARRNAKNRREPVASQPEPRPVRARPITA